MKILCTCFFVSSLVVAVLCMASDEEFGQPGMIGIRGFSGIKGRVWTPQELEDIYAEVMKGKVRNLHRPGLPGEKGDKGVSGRPGTPGMVGSPGPQGESLTRRGLEEIFLEILGSTWAQRSAIPPITTPPTRTPRRTTPPTLTPTPLATTPIGPGALGPIYREIYYTPVGDHREHGDHGDMGLLGPSGESLSREEIGEIFTYLANGKYKEHVGPRGPPGDTGAPGLPGIPGIPGPPGPPGKSLTRREVIRIFAFLYEVHEEPVYGMESYPKGLKGEKGPPGPIGFPGSPGTTRADVKKFFTDFIEGRLEITELQGFPGPKGFRGSPGLPGFDGMFGPPGLPGLPGNNLSRQKVKDLFVKLRKERKESTSLLYGKTEQMGGKSRPIH